MRVPAIVIAVFVFVFVIVFVFVDRAVGMAVEATHQQTSRARSIDAIRNSSPLIRETSLPSQEPHRRIGIVSVVRAPQARHSTTPGP